MSSISSKLAVLAPTLHIDLPASPALTSEAARVTLADKVNALIQEVHWFNNQLAYYYKPISKTDLRHLEKDYGVNIKTATKTLVEFSGTLYPHNPVGNYIQRPEGLHDLVKYVLERSTPTGAELVNLLTIAQDVSLFAWWLTTNKPTKAQALVIWESVSYRATTPSPVRQLLTTLTTISKEQNLKVTTKASYFVAAATTEPGYAAFLRQSLRDNDADSLKSNLAIATGLKAVAQTFDKNVRLWDSFSSDGQNLFDDASNSIWECARVLKERYAQETKRKSTAA